MVKNSINWKEPLEETLELLGVKKGTKIYVKCGRRSFTGVVELITPSFLVIITNPEKKRVLLRINRISWLEILEEKKGK